MTQNMQRYFGFRVKVSDFLEPTDYHLLRNRVVELLEKGKIDTESYKIFLHQLVFEADRTHFGVDGGLPTRLAKAYLRFSVNHKQRKSGDIQFVNHLFEHELAEDIGHYYLPNEIGYTIPSSFFKDRLWFQNVLVTLVRVGMREAHKKIKVSVSVDPAPEYIEQLRRSFRADSTTEIDINFNKVSEFNRQTRFFVHSSRHDQGGTMSDTSNSEPGTTINLNGPVGTFISQSPNATANGVATVYNSPDLVAHVVKELKTLQVSIQDQVSELPKKELGVIEGVIAEAPQNPEALKRLSSLGGWLLKASESVGLSLLAALLKGELGL